MSSHRLCVKARTIKMFLRILYWFISLTVLYILLSVYGRRGFIAIEERPEQQERTIDIPLVVDNLREKNLVNYNMALAAYQESVNRQRGKLKAPFVLVPNALIPQTAGNFQCDNSEVDDLCGFYVEGYEEALQLCEIEYQDQCNAFVLTKHMMVYLKKDVSTLAPSEDSSLFVRNQILENLLREKNFNLDKNSVLH